MRTKDTPELIRELAAESDAVKVEAARQLGFKQDQLVVAALIAALSDKTVFVQIAAADALGHSKDKSVPDALWKALNDKTRSDHFRVAAAVSLANLHDARAAETLVKMLPDAPEQASRALTELGDLAVPSLVSALRVFELRDLASQILISTGRGVDALIPLLGSGETRSTRAVAARILADENTAPAADALNAASKSGGLEITAASYRFFIRQGESGSETVLIRALNAFGTPKMAADFVSSGNPTLKAAGENWARIRNISLTALPDTVQGIRWGGIDPNVKQLGLYHFDGSLATTSGKMPVRSVSVSFVPGKWGTALSVGHGGILEYPLSGNLDFRDGSIEVWISPKVDGDDPVFSRYNHALVLYRTLSGEQFLVSESVHGGFYAGVVVNHQYIGPGGGSISSWKAGSWHHIAFTWSSNAKRQRFYIDGRKITETNGPLPVPATHAGTFTVGCDPFGNWTAFNVDELLISSAEKTPDAIRYGALRSTPFTD